MNRAHELFFNTELIFIDLSNINMQDIDGQFLSSLLYSNTILKHLDVSKNQLGTQTCIQFGLAL